MSEVVENLVFRRNARRRKVISGTGWAIILVLVFAVTALAVFSISAIVNRDVYALATPLPVTSEPIAVGGAQDRSEVPGSTPATTAPEDMKRPLLSAFIEAWNSIAFQGGVPDEPRVQEILAQHFWPDGPAYIGATEIFTAARQTDSYWRREIVGQVSISSLVEFSQAGDEAQFSFGLPASSVRSELIDIRSGQVIASQSQDMVLTVAMRYEPVAKRWKVYDIQTTKP